MVFFWICNNITSQKYEKLSHSECAEVLCKIQESDLPQWFAWQKGWPNWKPITEVPDLMSLYRVSDEPPPPPPPMIEDAPPPVPTIKLETEDLVIKTSTTADKITASDKPKLPTDLPQAPTAKEQFAEAEKKSEPVKKEDLRKHPRFNIRYKVIIENDIITFRSFTSNISLGGVALEHSLPEKMLVNDCKIYISDLDNTETIMFKINPIRRGSDLKFFSFEGLDEVYLNKLDNWIRAHAKI